MLRPSAFLLLLTLACDRTKEPDPRELASRALHDLMTYPRSSVTNVAAGSDAAEVTLFSSADPALVAEWYSITLRSNGWDLKGDAKNAQGVVTIFAEKEGRPLWITLRRNADPSGTIYTLVGALPQLADSVAPAPGAASPPATPKRTPVP